MVCFCSDESGSKFEGDYDIDAATRRSIGEYFPLGSIMKLGSNNPVTIHSADPKLFRAVYSLIAETMCVTIILDRSIKEEISRVVSERNRCPVCVVAHTMMETVASSVEQEQHKEQQRGSKLKDSVMEYTEFVLDQLEQKRKEQQQPRCDAAKRNTNASSLDKPTMAEVALVVMLFDHMNRVVSAIMGEEMSTTMFSVPRSIAKTMENPDLVSRMSKWMSSLLSGPFKAENPPGITRPLFRDEEKEELDDGGSNKNDNTTSSSSSKTRRIPDHLRGVELAGAERTSAVVRILDWIDAYEEARFAENDFVSSDIVALLDREIKSKNHELSSHPGKVLKWVKAYVREEEVQLLSKELADSENGTAVVTVLLLLSLAPQTIYQSLYWENMIDRLGSIDKARCVVFWWSLRTTFRDATHLGTT